MAKRGPMQYSRDNVQFVVDALEQGWTVKKNGVFYEIFNDTSTDSLKVPAMQNAKSLHALFEDVPKLPIENIDNK